MTLRPWLAVPVAAIACAMLAAVAGRPPEAIFAIAGLGAAIAAAVRAFSGPSIAAAVAGAAGALLGVLGVLALDVTVTRGALAGGAAMFAICELVRPKPPNASPLPAVAASLVGAALDPSYVALVAIAGAHLVADPWPRPRWMIALPIGGVLAVAMAIVLAATHASAWTTWTGRAPHAGAAVTALGTIGDLVGPIAAVAAIAGLALCAARGRNAASVIGAVIGGAFLVAGCSGIGASIPILAGIAAGVAISRLAAMIRWPAGQWLVCTTCGFLMIAVPAWTVIAR